MTATDPKNSLAGLLPALKRPLRLIDVGCRWGPDGAWSVLGDQAQVIGFDADPAECAALEQRFAGIATLRFVPLALGAKAGSRTIHLTKEPACSSIYPPNPDAIDRFPGMDGIRPARETTVHMTTLDLWLKQDGIDVVDFLKIDTQGAELEVLSGAKQALSAIRMLEVEVQFNPIYTGVPLFGEVDAFLRRHGFVLWRLSNLAHYGLAGGLSKFERPEVSFFGADHPVHFAGQGGQLWWANAFFVRRELAQGLPAEDAQAGLRDVCLAGMLDFWDLAASAANLMTQ